MARAKRILVVDDEQGICVLYKDELETRATRS